MQDYSPSRLVLQSSALNFLYTPRDLDETESPAGRLAAFDRKTPIGIRRQMRKSFKLCFFAQSTWNLPSLVRVLIYICMYVVAMQFVDDG